jgi:hypothetical protein
MDVFKLFFETTVVGVLTFGWLGIASYLLFPGLFDFIRVNLSAFLDKNLDNNSTAVGVGALILTYCLGSAVLPIASQLVNDEHWPLNENAIRCQVFTKQELNLESVLETAFPKDKHFSLTDLTPRHCSYWAPIFTEEDIGIRERGRRFFRRWVGLPTTASEDVTRKGPDELEKICKQSKTTECDEFKAKKILTIFQLQEAAALGQPSDRTESLRQLHERIVVLRGTVFSGFVLLLICLFAYFARVNGGESDWVRPACGVLLAIAFTVFAAFNGYQDLVGRNIFDIPVLESLLVVITTCGLVLALRKAKNRLFQSKRYLLITLFFTGLAYGGWIWSEIIYDQQVISSFVGLQQTIPVEHREPPSSAIHGVL